jgi:hypothetical protein
MTISAHLPAASTPSIGSVPESRRPPPREESSQARTPIRGRHELRDADGTPVTGPGDTFGPGGRHSRTLMDEPTELIFLDPLRYRSASDAELPASVGSRLMPPGTADTESADTGDAEDAAGELPKRRGWHGPWEHGAGTWTPPKTTDELADLLDNLRRWNPEGD